MRRARLAALLGCAAVLPEPAEAGANAAWTAPEGTWISEFSGKMNVPKKAAKFYNGHPTFLWPGLDPTGQATGLFQPVLTLGQGGRRDPNEPWTIANWFSRCGPYDALKKEFGAKYCHDAYQNVKEGVAGTRGYAHLHDRPRALRIFNTKVRAVSSDSTISTLLPVRSHTSR